MRALLGSTFVILALVGCGAKEFGNPIDPVDPTPPESLQQPTLRMIGPTGVAVGEDITIMGENFPSPEVGEARVTFTGTYLTTSGQSVPVNTTVVPRNDGNQGVLRWTFGPNIPFANGVEDTGVFRGVAKVVNVGRDGKQLAAPRGLSVEIRVLPSILIRQMRPVGASCGVGIKGTTENQKFLFELKAIGLKEGTNIRPMQWGYTFLREHFHFEGYFANTLRIDPEGVFPKAGAVTVFDEVEGSISRLGTGTPHNVRIAHGAATEGLAQIASGTDKLFGLVHLKTAAIGNQNAESYKASVSVIAIDADGLQARRTFNLTVWSPVEIDYDGNASVVRSFDPVPVSGCIHGGNIGRDVRYAEASSETRSRSYDVDGRLKLEGSIWVAKLSAEFGLKVNASVTSSQSQDLSITGLVLPKEFAVFYRQTLQLERRAKLRQHDSCGNALSLGDVIVTDWVWSPDLAKGKGCPPLPPSNLPKGQYFKTIN